MRCRVIDARRDITADAAATATSAAMQRDWRLVGRCMNAHAASTLTSRHDDRADAGLYLRANGRPGCVGRTTVAVMLCVDPRAIGGSTSRLPRGGARGALASRDQRHVADRHHEIRGPRSPARPVRYRRRRARCEPAVSGACRQWRAGRWADLHSGCLTISRYMGYHH